jgi:O-methyltransferase
MDFLEAWAPLADGTDTPVCKCKAFKLYDLATQALHHVPGHFYECGVYRGATASIIAAAIDTQRELHLYDTFTGIAGAQPIDEGHQNGDFGDVDLAAVKARVPTAVIHQGPIPTTFEDLGPIAFAHIDVDVFQAHLDAIDFIWPRMSSGGIMVFDDYAQPSCRGAHMAVDFRFLYKHEIRETIQGQAFVMKP